jgi:heat shock transcription factor
LDGDVGVGGYGGGGLGIGVGGQGHGHGLGIGDGGVGGLGGGGGLQPGRVFETTSANNTPSPAATEEITRADFDASPERGTKRQRRG